VTSRVGLVAEREIEVVYQANKDRYKGDEAAARDQIRAQLQSQKLAVKREEFVQALRAKGTVVVRLQAPPVTRVEVSIDGAPVKGPAAAPVTIVGVRGRPSLARARR